MAQLLAEIEWGEPLVPSVVVPEWESEAKRRFGGTQDYWRRVAPVPWLRSACAEWTLFPLTTLPVRLADLAFLVVSQENACRYCYGAARAHLRILGYSERFIGQLEREAQLAELDARDQVFLRFCRNLARSNPRPARAQRDELLRAGFTERQVAETAFYIAAMAFGNRMATILALPPVLGYERIARSLLGRLLRPMLARANRASIPMPTDFVAPDDDPFSPLTRALAGLPAAHLLHQTLSSALDSPILSRRVKLLMFGVVARMLECQFCLAQSCRMLQPEGFDESEALACLAALDSPKLDPTEVAVLEWVRETVRYQPMQIQKRTRALSDRIGALPTLEAVGMAALANATVRVATLLA
jgi:alkylhydroperoxidase family enzyme